MISSLSGLILPFDLFVSDDQRKGLNEYDVVASCNAALRVDQVILPGICHCLHLLYARTMFDQHIAVIDSVRQYTRGEC